MFRITPLVLSCLFLGMLSSCKSDCNEETNIEVLTNCYLQGEDERVYSFVMNVTPTCKQYELSYYLDNNEMNTIPVSNGMEVILGSRLPTIITYLSKESSGYERSISLLNDAFMDLECGGQPGITQEDNGLQVAENEYDKVEEQTKRVQPAPVSKPVAKQNNYTAPVQSNNNPQQGTVIETNRSNNTTTVEIFTPANIEIYSPNPVVTRTIPAEEAPNNTEIIMEAENTTIDFIDEEVVEETPLVIPEREKITAVENVSTRNSSTSLGSSNKQTTVAKAPQVTDVNKAEYTPEPTAQIQTSTGAISTTSRPVAAAPKPSAPKPKTPSIVKATPPSRPSVSAPTRPTSSSSTTSTKTSKTGMKNLKEKGGIRSSNKCNGTDSQYMAGPYTMNIKAKKKLKLENFRVYADSQGTVDLIINSLSMDEAEIMDDIFVLPSEAGTAINIYSLGITMNPGEEYAITVNPVTKGLRFESSAACTTDIVSSPLADIQYVDKKVVFFDLQFIY